MKLPRISTQNLYLLTLAAFAVLVIFLDKNNLLDGWQLKGKIDALEEQRLFYLDKIREDSLILERLKEDAFLEEFAREHYYMKRPGETIYLVK